MDEPTASYRSAEEECQGVEVQPRPAEDEQSTEEAVEPLRQRRASIGRRAPRFLRTRASHDQLGHPSHVDVGEFEIAGPGKEPKVERASVTLSRRTADLPFRLQPLIRHNGKEVLRLLCDG